MTDPRHKTTIAVPVFNEQLFIEETLRSAVRQAANILVCDNASIDGTGEIVIRLAKEFDNIRYIRHATNLGAINNYLFALEAADTEYFLWLGGHDKLAEHYVERLSAALDNDAGAVLAFPPSQIIDRHGDRIGAYACDFSAPLKSERAHERVYAMICRLTDCSMVHGLFRREALQRSWFNVPCMGFDHVVLCRSAALGRVLFVEGTSYLRRIPRAEDSKEKQLERITAQTSSLQDDCYDPMLKGQFEVMRSLPAGFIWREKARVQLIRRFGFFRDGTAIGSYENRLIAAGIDSLRGLRKLVQPDPRESCAQ